MTLFASDLDGTLIPPRASDRHLGELARFARVVESARLRVAYVTGRHLSLALEGVATFGLPEPEAIACDVGTTIYWRGPDGYVVDDEYRGWIEASSGVVDRTAVRVALEELTYLRLQPESGQTGFKISYDVEGGAPDDFPAEVARRLEAVGDLRPVHSSDPWTGRGLLDVLPASVGKRTAVEHIARRLGYAPSEAIFAGDSGNDRDAILSGMRSIVVANASSQMVADLERQIRRAHGATRVYFASRPFAMGVVEGLHHFNVAPVDRIS